MKNLSKEELVSNIRHAVSAINNILNNCQKFFQFMFYNGVSKENYSVTKVRLCNKQKTKELRITFFRSSVTQTSYPSSKLSVIELQ